MTFTPERASVNQRTQIGAESTIGTAVAASKTMLSNDFVFGPAADIKMYRPSGYKYDTDQELNIEWVDGTMAGTLDYNAAIYPAGSVYGAVTPVAHGSSAVAKDWIYIPPITGSTTPQTYSFEQGESTTRAHKFAYGLFTQFGYKCTRKDVSASGKLMGQQISDGITLTASPTAVALAPVIGAHWNVYLDSSSAGIGVTLLTRVLSLEYSMDSVYGPFYALNRATPSYSAHVDMAPKATVKMMLEADSNGMSILPLMRNGVTYYARVQAQGAVIDNNQTGTITGAPTGGTFTLTYKGQTTAGIAFNATGATVQTAFLALSTVGAGNATVAGAAGGPYTINMAGTLLTDLTAITASGAGLTGGASPTITITQTQIYNTFQHDLALKVSKPNPFKDDAGIFAVEWEFTLVADTTWASGQAQKLLITNLLTSL